MDKSDLLMLVNVLLGAVAFFGTLVGRNLTEAIKDLREADEKIAAKLEHYVRKDDLHDIKQQINAIFRKLDEIKDGLSTKIDRGECEMQRSRKP